MSFTDSHLGPKDLGAQVIEVLEPPRAELRLELHGDMVGVRGGYSARLLLACSRCLEPMELAMQGPLKVVFQPQPQALGGEEVELADDDLEVSFYSGEEVDLSFCLHDEIALALPMAPLCRPDCPGICPVCGKSLRDGPCGCQAKKTDPRWAKLAKLDLK
ncbi:hypothetical protein AAU61_13855 [Desulfocarbo indianensis]|nr:hypothetical protein AAU61_13855 [Desulfocarbo indianensis]